MIVSLSNYAVSLHDEHSYEPIESPLARSRNASAFAVTSNIIKDPTTGIPEIVSRLAVAVKRRLLLWAWHAGEIAPDVTEIVLTEAIRTITWANATRVVCGMNAGYVMVDAVTQKVEDIVGPGAIGGAAGGQGRFGAVSSAGMGYMGLGGYVPKPLSTKLADGQLLLAKDINTLFIDDTGKALEKRQIPWATAPESIGYSYPYILALQAPSRGGLEVRNPDTLSLLQTVALPGATALHFAPTSVSLAHAGKGFYVLGERAVWKMDATNYDAQISELVKTARYDEAVSVLNMLEDALLKDKVETLREVKMLKAELLFHQKKFREAMDLFNEEDVYAPPDRVLRLFPNMIAGRLSAMPEEKESEGEVKEAGANGKASGDKSAKDVHAGDQASTSVGLPFTKYFIGQRKITTDAAPIASVKKGPEDDGASSKDKAADEQSQQEKDLMAAVIELSSYLAGARARLQRVIDPATGKLKPRRPTTGSTEEDFKSLLRSLRQESDDKLEKEVKEAFGLVDTALFRAYMYSRPTLASSLFRIPNFCDPDVVKERLVEHNRFNELVDFLHGKKLHRQALELLRKYGSPAKPDPVAPSLHGPGRTVMYLQTIPPEMVDLILEFSEWTLQRDPKLGMEVFIADSENAETLPRGRVVHFLRRIDPALERQYLEHVIGELNDATPEFHDRLVELMVKQLKGGKAEDEGRHVLMERFVQFLRQSRQYGFTKAFGMIPRDGTVATRTQPPAVDSASTNDAARPRVLRGTGSGPEQHRPAQAST